MKRTIIRCKFIKLMCFGLGPAAVNRVVSIRFEHNDGRIEDKYFINGVRIPTDVANRNVELILSRLGKLILKYKYTI